MVNKNKIIKKPEKEKALAKKYTPEEVKNKVLQNFTIAGELKTTLKELGDDIFPKFINGSKKEQEEIREKLLKKVTDVMMALETDSHWALAASFIDDFRGMARELSSQVIKEHNCSTHTEKMLAEIVAGSFIRFLDNSRRLNNELACTTINENRTKYITILSKQTDRAHRQYISSLMALKQLKTPTIEMNIKANTAFVSQNQQFNAPQAKNENNEPK